MGNLAPKCISFAPSRTWNRSGNSSNLYSLEGMAVARIERNHMRGEG